MKVEYEALQLSVKGLTRDKFKEARKSNLEICLKNITVKNLYNKILYNI